MAKKLVMIGTGLQAEVMYAYFAQAGEYEVVAFAADSSFVEKMQEKFGRPVVDTQEVSKKFPPADHDAFVAVGFRNLNQIRARLYAQIKQLGYRCATYVHDSVVRWPQTTFGENVFVFEDNTVQPFAVIEDNTVLWSGNHIGHHSIIGKHCFISSHVVVSGNCVVGDSCFIGVNATLRDSIKIGARNIIGPGALILKDTADDQVFLPKGTEARDISSNKVRL